jgi:hypothetical protein
MENAIFYYHTTLVCKILGFSFPMNLAQRGGDLNVVSYAGSMIRYMHLQVYIIFLK